MQFMFIGSTKLVDVVAHRFECQYGSNDLTNVVKDITQNHNVALKKLDINGNVIPLGISHEGTQLSSKSGVVL
jgi:hypothetical protein